MAFSAAIPMLFTEPGLGIQGKEESAFSKFPTHKKWEEKGKEVIMEWNQSPVQGHTEASEQILPVRLKAGNKVGTTDVLTALGKNIGHQT